MALANDRLTQRKTLGLQAYPVKASTIIYAGSLVAIDSNGWAVPAADAAGHDVIGIAHARADNSTGANGAIKVTVEAPIRVLLKATSITQAMVGQAMYVVDDETFDDQPGTNAIFAGILSEYVSTTSGWLYVAPKFNFTLTDLTASAAELNVLDGVVAGTVSASKAVVVDSNKRIDTLVIADGGLKLGAAGGTAVSAVAAELNTVDGAPMGATFVVGTEGSNKIEVTVQLKDGAAGNLAVRGAVFAYLSDNNDGSTLVATAPSGTVRITPSTGAGLMIDVVAKKAFQLVSGATGLVHVEIEEAGEKTAYLVVVLANGKLAISGAITFAS
jgi:hypothetical protein